MTTSTRLLFLCSRFALQPELYKPDRIVPSVRKPVGPAWAVHTSYADWTLCLNDGATARHVVKKGKRKGTAVLEGPGATSCTTSFVMLGFFRFSSFYWDTCCAVTMPLTTRRHAGCTKRDFEKHLSRRTTTWEKRAADDEHLSLLITASCVVTNLTFSLRHGTLMRTLWVAQT